MTMNRCRPKVLAEGVGFQWPTPGPREAGYTSSQRASSPRLEQGGTGKTLIRPTWLRLDTNSQPAASKSRGSPQSALACRRLAPAGASANPTTPVPAGVDHDYVVPPPVPSVAATPSADAGCSHVPAAPTRPPAGRRWSAYADDDSGRSAFPLEPPSFAPGTRWPATRAGISSHDLAVALRSIRVPQRPSGAGRAVS